MSRFKKRFDVFWKPKAQAADSNDDEEYDKSKDPIEFVTSVTCRLHQGFPLAKEERDEGNIFRDSTEDLDIFINDSCEECVFQDSKLTYFSLMFCENISQGKPSITGTGPKTVKLNEVITSIDTNNEEKKQNLFGTEVLAWGDNTCNCLVRSQTFSNHCQWF